MSEFRFSEVDEHGKELNIRILKRSDIMACPGVILLASHYREDGSCRHNEPTCEQENCINLKFEDEIFCKTHCQEKYGY